MKGSRRGTPKPPDLLSMCILDQSGGCSVPSQSPAQTIEHARFQLLAATALPACLGVAWEAFRPDFGNTEPDPCICKLLYLALGLGIFGGLYALSMRKEEVEPWAAEVLFFLMIGLACSFCIRQLHWRAEFWMRFHRTSSDGKTSTREQFILEQDTSNSRCPIRRNQTITTTKVFGNRAKVLHLKKPLPGWPGPFDFWPRIEAAGMMLQSTVAPFYFFESWPHTMVRLSRKVNNVPLIAQDEVAFLAYMSGAFVIGKLCLLVFIMLAPALFSDDYVRYNTQDLAGNVYNHAIRMGRNQSVDLPSHAVGFFEIAHSWPGQASASCWLFRFEVKKSSNALQRV